MRSSPVCARCARRTSPPSTAAARGFITASTTQRETTIDGILAAAKSKRYAYARLRRLLLAAYLGVTPEDIPQRVPYLRVLACNARGREVLRCMKTTAAAMPNAIAVSTGSR